MQYSTIAAKQVLRGADRPQAFELHGRVRIAVVDTVFAAEDDKVCLVKFPAGRVRILGMSAVSAKVSGDDNILAIGVSEHQNSVRQLKPANTAALLAPVKASSIKNGANLKASGLSGFVIDSVNGFDVIATLSAPAKVGDTITGVILYVID